MNRIIDNKKESMNISSTTQQKRREETFQLTEKIKKILESHKTPYEKKTDL